MHATVLPPAYRNYDLHSYYKVVLKEPTPWVYNRKHRTAYKKYRKAPVQPTLRSAHDPRYASQGSRPAGQGISTVVTSTSKAREKVAQQKKIVRIFTGQREI